ncbi:MAG: SDR family oxidoreductase [Myxococcota bacterium]
MSAATGAKRALVTGGAGFIGHHLAARLLAHGWAVRVLDDLSSGRRENVERAGREAELCVGDIRDASLLQRCLDGVDVVFHQAAVASVPRSVADPVGTSSVNVEGTLAVLEASRRAGVRRVVLASSSAVYGDDPAMPKVETQPVRLLSPYALHKYTDERMARLYAELYGLETVCLRYFNVYGPRQDPESDYAAVIPLFVSAALQGKAVRIHGDGEQTRDFVYVGDVVEANRLAAVAPGVSGEVFNVAAGSTISVNALAQTIGECVGIELEAVHEDERPGDVRDSWADVGKIARGLGFEAQTRLADGLARTVEAHREGRGHQGEME